jgi:signal transduction histidine kinase
VTDHGPGIAPEAKDRVFDWFETDSRGSQHRGPGLGLSLVRSFVELHGGTVSIESAPGQGYDSHLRISGTTRRKANRGMTAIALARWCL